MAIFDDENQKKEGGSTPFGRSTTASRSTLDTKEGSIVIGAGVSVTGDIDAPNEVSVNGRHTGKVISGKITVRNGCLLYTSDAADE